MGLNHKTINFQIVNNLTFGCLLNNEFIEFIEWIVNAATATNKTNVVHSTLESLPGGELKVRCRPKTALTKKLTSSS